MLLLKISALVTYQFYTAEVILMIKRPFPSSSFSHSFIKGALKAHIHISLYESNTLQEQDAALLFLSVIPRGEIFEVLFTNCNFRFLFVWSSKASLFMTDVELCS